MTFGEFWALSEEKRPAAFSKLSPRDRMLVRQQQASVGTPQVIPCNGCEYRIGITAACAAHPEGLTADHVREAIYHCENRETHK